MRKNTQLLSLIYTSEFSLSLEKTVVIFVLIACSQRVLHAAELSLQVQVESGNYERTSVPVSFEINVPSSHQYKSVSVINEGLIEQGQIETVSSEVIRVWWIIDQIGANQSRIYDLVLSDETIEGSRFHWNISSVGEVESTDLLDRDRPVLRYVHTPFDGNDIELTKKPFHQVYDVAGENFITKGVGGRFSHHRGIFFGYQECQIGNSSYDTWHARNGEHQEHTEFKSIQEGDVFGGHASVISWNDRQGNPFALEERLVRVFAQPTDQRLVEVQSVVSAVNQSVELSGDRQHAGLQFRASQEVADNESNTRFLRPDSWSHLSPSQEINNGAHVDLPWNAMQFRIADEKYTVAYMSHPENPGDAEFSERLYGRFGEYVSWSLDKENPLTLNYRFWISTQEDLSRSQIQQRYDAYFMPMKVTQVERRFIRGDVDRNGSPGFTDAILLLRALFSEEPTSLPECWDSADVDDDGRVNLSDVMFSLYSIFVPNFREPPPPYPSCGVDPTEDSLGCENLTCP